MAARAIERNRRLGLAESIDKRSKKRRTDDQITLTNRDNLHSNLARIHLDLRCLSHLSTRVTLVCLILINSTGIGVVHLFKAS